MFKPSGERRPLLNRVNRPPRGRLYDSGTVAVLGAARSDASPSSLAWNIGESTLQSVLDVIRRQCGYVIPWVDFLRFKPSGERHPLFKRKCHSPRGPLYDKETAAVRGAARSAASPHLAAEESASGRMSRGARRDFARRILEAQAQRRASRGAEDIAPTSPPFDAFERSGCIAKAAARSAASLHRALLGLHGLGLTFFDRGPRAASQGLRLSAVQGRTRLHRSPRVSKVEVQRRGARSAPRFPVRVACDIEDDALVVLASSGLNFRASGAGRTSSADRRYFPPKACGRRWSLLLREWMLASPRRLVDGTQRSTAPPLRCASLHQVRRSAVCRGLRDTGVDRRRDPRGESVQRRRARLKSVRRAPRGARHASVCLSHEHSRGRRQSARAVSLDGDAAVSSPGSVLQRTKRGACVAEAL
ncbi:hypothetical protein SCP_0309820 [Sparassis crispa]|uniref:Uncharacterized protein n=1 Tax=Sparassis crispa TaxID=139825 RepID=A0A401GGD6_9APHY|nr:hypothetical protein SCP_0309730 [Sparassis crispa]XP_027612168.1 hypothetical protein SCP_0309820 [Sparassis crispa]GBE81246.1 hypothetical protein SCP_0309730 [Sparassis crispa]GBE81255.1 hypothetical protein SCP_0309820 [Sparassis crispa]